MSMLKTNIGRWMNQTSQRNFNSIPLRSILLQSIRLRSVPLRSVPLRSIPFRSIPFRSIRLPTILSQAWSLKSADPKRALQTARLECCAVSEIQRMQKKKNPLKRSMHQQIILFGSQKSLVTRPTINSAVS